MDEITREFIIESNEGLDQVDQDLVALEQDPTDPDLLAAIFRCIHTIKGTCGFLGFSKLESVTHVGENVLSKLRDGELVLSPDLTNVLLAMIDAVRAMIVNIEANGDDGDADHSQLIESLSQALEPAEGSQPVAGNLAKAGPKAAGEDPAETAKTAVDPALADTAPVPTLATNRNIAETSIRVDVRLLDRLMNLVGELVLTRNQIIQASADTILSASAQSLNLITTELQEAVMKTRMQPISNISGKFPRVVRDLAASCGKNVRIEMDGTETEVDKTLIEAIKDPLTHLVRNAVDHGIESPNKRVAAGKPAQGRILLRAFHEGGQVNIQISDDGGGIDPQRLRNKAVERQIMSIDQAAAMSERDVVNLIFHPGFSTAKAVTNVSGRGVGMDVVKTNIERIGGSIDVQSDPGLGTTLKLKIPLTLAIIPALVVTSGDDRFAIPQISLLELVRLEGEDVGRKIEQIQGAPVYRLRGNLLPLVFLDRELRGIHDNNPGATPRHRDDVLNIVVLQTDERPFGLVIDDVRDTAEIVVKPLDKLIQSIPIFAGATIMGDGRVALILDVVGLAQSARVVSEMKERVLPDKKAGPNTVAADQRQSLLLFRSPEPGGRMAMPLSTVARLEKISRQRIETAGGKDVVQYRGGILRLVYLKDILNRASAKGQSSQPDDALQVVVYSLDNQSVGLVVEHIIDIVETQVKIEQTSEREGIVGTMVILDRVTELLDIDNIIDKLLLGSSKNKAA